MLSQEITVDFTKISMEKIRLLLKELEERRTWVVIREFLYTQGLLGKQIRSWSSIKDSIEGIQKDAGDWQKLLPNLDKFLQQIFLFGQKRVFMIASKTIKPELLAAGKLQSIDLGFFSDMLPERPEGHVGYHFKQWRLGELDIHTFISRRTAHINQKVQADDLGKELLAKYKLAPSSTVNFRTPSPVRVYDHYVVCKNQAYLLIDQPDYVESLSVDQDALKYEGLIKAQDTSKQQPFTDLFRILKPIYNDDKEGLVNYVDFVSNDHATVRGKYNHSSNKDYRKQSFQQAGVQSGAQVDPFVLGLKWLNVGSHPSVLFSGEKEMAEAATAESQGTVRRALEFMGFPGHMDEAGFLHVVSRVLYHLGQLEGQSAPAASPTASPTASPAASPAIPMAAEPVGAQVEPI